MVLILDESPCPQTSLQTEENKESLRDAKF